LASALLLRRDRDSAGIHGTETIDLCFQYAESHAHRGWDRIGMETLNRFEDAQTNDGRYRLLVEAITDYAIYMLDREGRVTSWNPGAKRFKGYEADEIIGQHFSTFYTEAERSQNVPALALAEAERTGRFEREGWRVRKDGTQFWAHVVIDAIRSPEGELVGFAKITRDLTERRAAEAKLRESEAQFRLLVQSVIDYAIYMLDIEGHVASWNAGAQHIKGYAPEEIIGRHFSDFYTDADRAAGLPRIGLETATRNGRWEHEGQRVRKDGTAFWAHVVIDAIRDDAGKLVGFAKDDAMRNDMVCQCVDGEMRLDHRDGHPFTVKRNDVWTCVKGEPEDTENIGDGAAIMRVINLMPA
jgi:PAS domain S-box-containing protein